MTLNELTGAVAQSTPEVGGRAVARRAAPQGEDRAAETVRKAAAQFEALLLTQMTARLNSSSDDEDSLFGGGDAGASSLYRQMFSEQLAGTMAESGGVGIADLMLSQMGLARPAPTQTRGLTRAVEASHDLLRGDEQTAVSRADRRSPSQMAVADTNPALTDDVYLVSEADVPPGVDLRPPNAIRPRRVNAETLPLKMPVAKHASVAPMLVKGEFASPLPVEGRLSARFGLRHDPFTGEARFHDGLDIAAPRGTPIASVADGTVVFAGRQRGYGRTVVIDHGNGLRTRYAHADSLDVQVGARVQKGQIVAAVGSTGRSTGPHLHFEVTKNGHPVEPSTFFAKAPWRSRR